VVHLSGWQVAQDDHVIRPHEYLRQSFLTPDLMAKVCAAMHPIPCWDALQRIQKQFLRVQCSAGGLDQGSAEAGPYVLSVVMRYYMVQTAQFPTPFSYVLPEGCIDQD
jgi:hypothetical protein